MIFFVRSVSRSTFRFVVHRPLAIVVVRLAMFSLLYFPLLKFTTGATPHRWPRLESGAARAARESVGLMWHSDTSLRSIHVAPAASPRPVSADYPRGSRGVSATPRHGYPHRSRASAAGSSFLSSPPKSGSHDGFSSPRSCDTRFELFFWEWRGTRAAAAVRAPRGNSQSSGGRADPSSHSFGAN